MGKDVIPINRVAEKILYLREQKVILDRDLARLCGVQTRVLKQAVKRNSGRFPSGFASILARAEIERISQFVTSSSTLRFSKQVRVFTEQGVTTLSRGRCDE
jgi:ORF6N domain